MKERLIIFLKNEQDTLDLGEKFAELLHDDFNIYLSGELGAGKTTLVRGFLRGLNYKGAVKSPTYTLVEHYKLQKKQIYHFDFYRVTNPYELELAGVRDYFSQKAIRLIEWPKRADKFLPLPDWNCYIMHKNKGREIQIEAHSERGYLMLNLLKKHYASSN